MTVSELIYQLRHMDEELAVKIAGLDEHTIDSDDDLVSVELMYAPRPYIRLHWQPKC